MTQHLLFRTISFDLHTSYKFRHTVSDGLIQFAVADFDHVIRTIIIEIHVSAHSHTAYIV